jgi:hypothetical protein
MRVVHVIVECKYYAIVDVCKILNDFVSENLRMFRQANRCGSSRNYGGIVLK